MQIKSAKEPAFLGSGLAARWLRRQAFRAIVLCLYGVVALALGVYLHSSGRWTELGRSVGERLHVLRAQNVRLLANAGAGRLATAPRLVISLKFEDFQRLERKRAEALAAQVLVLADEDYVPARLEHDGQSVRVKMRLKGDLTDHLRGRKWSFRIKTRGEETFLGMKQFSLHHPDTRNNVYEWVYHRALHREDLLGLRYDFVRVTLNGRDLGVYALEEHFEKRLIEHNRRREGPIVRFSEDRLWEDWRDQKIPFPGARQSGGGSYLASPVDAFQSARWQADPETEQVYARAVSLLEEFRRGEKKASEVFDVDRLALSLAITDLMGGEHAARWHNVRFYYNPVTSRLEPIGFDANAGQPLECLLLHMRDKHWSYNAWSSDSNYFQALFSDSVVVEAYIRSLERVSRPQYLEDFLTEVYPELRDKLRIIHSEDPSVEFSEDVLRQNQAYIRSILAPAAPIAAYYDPAGAANLSLRFGNLQSLPLEVLGVAVGAAEYTVFPDPVILSGRDPAELVSYRQETVALPLVLLGLTASLPEIRLQYRILGLESPRQAVVTPWPLSYAGGLDDDVVRKTPNAESFAFITLEADGRTLSVKPGDWTLAEDLVVPPGRRFFCGPGTSLRLTSRALILSFSPLHFNGSEDEPIMISSPDGTGQGLLVIGAEAESILHEVIFQDLSNPSRVGWSSTGAVTFYESDVSFQRCQFSGNRSEDALNVIRSRFRLLDSRFARTTADAVDADFCVGEIRGCTFSSIHNDGIDVSGSTVTITEVRVVQAGDKGVSVGENSQVQIKGLDVSHTKIGFAVKDSSHLEADQVRLTDTQIGCATYQKKPEFGPPSATVSRLEMASVAKPYVVESGSVLRVEGIVIPANAEGVWKTLEAEASQDAEVSGVPGKQSTLAGRQDSSH